jgi:S1-C subfamily serine protease
MRYFNLIRKNMLENEIKIPEIKDTSNDSSEHKSDCKCRLPISHNRLIFSLTLVFVAALVGAVFGFMGGSIAKGVVPDFKKIFSSDNGKNASNPVSEPNKQLIIEEESGTISVVDKSSPAVVSIIITKDVPKYRNSFSDPFGFNQFFNPNDSSDQDSENGQTQKQKIGGGSGFLVSDTGMIVTNRHVVEDQAADYTVITSDGKEYSAAVLARDPVRDIAVIKIEGSDFPVLPLGDSDNLKIGQTVIAIGNSLGEFSNSVSKGIISGLMREVTAGSGLGQEERLTGIIQTDAAINPGNSGGPLIDINGNVIGVNVAMAQGAENVGFALPIKQVKKIVDQVKSQGKISTPYLGVRYVIITPEIQKDNNLSFDYGVLVVRGQRMSDLAVIPGSPADKAGVIENDIILSINGEKITAKTPLADVISQFNVGDEITASVWHKGETKDYKITLEERK